ncbi:ATPase/kinase [Hyaloraphidium curvatum]|nr:ATPase/kinase [Hyaloraphidium curvatum]
MAQDSTSPPTRGLVLGKFAPFHRGHQLVLDTALPEVDELVVVAYDAPSVTDVPLSVRAGWIRRLYPSVRVVEAWDGPEAVGDTEVIRKLNEDYVQSLDLGRITHFYCSEFYGDHMSRFLGAVDRRVDEGRTKVPTSGTAIRRDPFAHRHLLDPLVYRDLVANVVFLGAPSTGKTTVAERLAAVHGTVWMPEYGREYWDQHQVDRRLAPAQLVEIAEGHLEREERKLLEANRYLFTDTNAITTYTFALEYHGSAEPLLAELADASARRYDVVFLCGDDIPYDDTWDRSGDGNRRTSQKRIAADLLARKIPFVTLEGSVEERVEKVGRVLARFSKYRSLGDALFAGAANGGAG